MSLIGTKCKCSQCKREDCKKCTNCIMNALSGRRLQTIRCFQTMCKEVSIIKKATKAEGKLPNDWYFYFEERFANEKVDGLFIFKKGDIGNHFQSFEAAAACYPNEFRDMKAKTFYQHVGIDHYEPTECIRKPDNPIGIPLEKQNNNHNRSNNKPSRKGLIALGLKQPGGKHPWPNEGNKKQKIDRDDALLGKGFWAEWIKVNGDIGTVVGQIIKVQPFKTVKCYTVRFGNLRDSSIPEIFTVYSDKAWCGCLAFEARISPENLILANIAPFHVSWVTPTSYRRSFDVNGTHLPRITVQYKMFVLDFKVKRSNIPDAGYGVFLSCKAWDIYDDDDHRSLKYFELPAGVLLDFGVYAPIRPEDKKEDSEFRLKNFIHKFSCEQYLQAPCSGLAENKNVIFDITDNFTGKLHEEAQTNVPSYLNEITSPEMQVPNVHAVHDYAGSVHYLLGHEREEQGPFRMEVGSEMEIFIDYGIRYENVRIRQGYPRRDRHNILESRKRLKKDEIEYVKEVTSYTSREVRNLIGSFKLALERKNDIGAAVAGRMVLALLLLRTRSENLLADDEGQSEQSILLETVMEYSQLVKRFIKTFWNSINDLHLTLMDDEIYNDFMHTFFEGEKDLSLLLCCKPRKPCC